MSHRIPVSQLKAGMEVITEDGKGAIKLVSYFRTSSKFPTISFRTNTGNIVIWRDCGFAYIK